MFDGLEVIANTKCSVKKEKKRREEQFSESVHCYSPTPPIIGRRRPKNTLTKYDLQESYNNLKIKLKILAPGTTITAQIIKTLIASVTRFSF